MMRIRFCLLIMLFAGRYALAQDVIVKQDGGTILSKVLEIGTQEIAYKKWNSQDGPVYKIAKDQVLSVNYQNGEVDRFACPSDNPRPEELPVVDVSPAEDNAMRIALYNNSIRSRKNETPGKFAARYTYKFGMSSNSVLSSEDLDISIVLNGNGNGSWDWALLQMHSTSVESQALSPTGLLWGRAVANRQVPPTPRTGY